MTHVAAHIAGERPWLNPFTKATASTATGSDVRWGKGVATLSSMDENQKSSKNLLEMNSDARWVAKTCPPKWTAVVAGSATG